MVVSLIFNIIIHIELSFIFVYYFFVLIGRASGGPFAWGSAPPPDFIRNLMQAVAGHMVQGGPANTRIITRNPLTVSQLTVASLDSGNTNAGQSTQAR